MYVPYLQQRHIPTTYLPRLRMEGTVIQAHTSYAYVYYVRLGYLDHDLSALPVSVYVPTYLLHVEDADADSDAAFLRPRYPKVGGT